MMKKIKYCNILAYVMFLLLILCISPFIVPKVFGYEPYGILSDSMEPHIKTGSVVYVKSCQPSEVETGDVITFKTSVQNNAVATHRVVLNDQNNAAFVTKGDHNEEADAIPVSYERLLGKVMVSIPFLGTLYLWIVSALGMAVCTFTLIMIMVLWYFVWKWKKDVKR